MVDLKYLTSLCSLPILQGGPGTSSHYSLFAHRMDSGHLMSQSLFPTLQGGPGTPYFPTLQGGPGTPYFPVLIPHTTRWTWNFLLPSAHSLHYKVDLEHLTSQCSLFAHRMVSGHLTSQCTFLTTRWTWNILHPSVHSPH